ncbi:unnamed protein product [Auanema sp. JU1783]|nr:unnamed protein product [Auanema sp. JU1783]
MFRPLSISLRNCRPFGGGSPWNTPSVRQYSKLLRTFRRPLLLSSARALKFSRPHILSRRTLAMATCAAPVKEKYERLPEFVRPTHYNISLSPDLVNFTFDGKVEVDLQIAKPTNVLKFHGRELEIRNIKLELADKSILNHTDIVFDDKYQIINVNFPVEIAPQQVKLTIDFLGCLNDKMRGFYRSSYKNQDGVQKFLASTQFESTYARYSFPCWDEPIFKATFDVSLIVDKEFTALSNMDVKTETLSECQKKKVVTFNTSPIMSTYLVAFAVGELEYLETKNESGTIVRVYTVPGKKDHGKFALSLAARALDWYNDWFDIPYPLPKCDLIGIPDFSMGAMENWGLVTYREVALLFDEEKSSTRQKARISLIIAHELAHLWFGDLVTMKWWTDLWLKEGFASFMEYLFVGYNYEDLQIWLYFLNDELAQGFKLDALRSSHPIEVEIDDPNELDEIYDSITYAKSNSVNRMLCYYLGEKTFQKGLRLYLKKYQYGNAVTVDLWDCLSEASGQDIAKLMSGWTKQMGYPLISCVQVQQGNDRVLKLKQKRFLADGGEDHENTLWQVPITVVSGSDPKAIKASFLLTEREQEFTLKDFPANDWLKLNAGTTGFYRVEYDEASFKNLLPAFSNGQMDVLDRFGIANDLFALVRAGKANADQFLTLLEAAKAEEENVVWGTLDYGISTLGNVLISADSDGTLKKRFDKFIVDILSPLKERVGWEPTPGESSQRSLMRSVILGRLSKAGHQDTIATMKSLFDEHVSKNKELQPDLRLSIYGSVARHSGEQVYDDLLNIYENVGFGEIERQALVALAQVPAIPQLEKLFEYGIIEGKIRSQDLMMIMIGPSGSKDGQEFLWSYFKKNVNVFLEKFGGVNASLFQHCFKLSAESFSTQEAAQEVESFFCSCLDANSVKTLDRPIRQVSEAIRLNHALLIKNAPIIDQFLKDRKH